MLTSVNKLYALNKDGYNFIEQTAENVTVRNYQNADSSLRK